MRSDHVSAFWDVIPTTTELYNLKTDLGEENNVAAKNPKIINEMLEIIKNSRTPSDVFTFGLETKNN